MTKKEKVVAFDCKKYPPLGKIKSNGNSTGLRLFQHQTETQNKASSITDLNTKELFETVQTSMDQLRADSLMGKQRRRFLEQLSIRKGEKKLEKALKVPSKILVGMRKKAKMREAKSKEEVKSIESNTHFLTHGVIKVQKYQMRNKEMKKVKDRERGLYLTHALQKRNKIKPKPFKPK